MSLESELRDASDHLLEELARLVELETAKRDVTPGTPEFVELSRKVEALAERVLGSSHRQSELAVATRVVAETDAAAAPTTPIAEVAPARDPSVVLNEWRETERKLAAASGAGTDADRLRARIEQLKDEYRRSFEARR